MTKVDYFSKTFIFEGHITKYSTFKYAYEQAYENTILTVTLGSVLYGTLLAHFPFFMRRTNDLKMH